VPSVPISGRLSPCLLALFAALACGDARAPDDEGHHGGEGPALVVPGLAPRVSAERSADEAHASTKPRLVVVVVVDQMRYDYLERFAAQWRGGFARMLAEGRSFTAAYHEHALTETAPGHATIATGTDPARHGVVSNRWLARETGAKVNAVDDPGATILCEGKGEPVGVSAATLLRESVGDWAQAADPDAVVVAMAVKDRAAILLGGKRPDAALWYDHVFGGFTTSSYYADARPAWVDAYNQQDRAAALYGESGWILSRPDADYGSSRRRTAPELVTEYNSYALTKQFPHVITDPDKAPRHVVRDLPFGDQMTLELAREAIASLDMGADEVSDLLLISLSNGDYAGHRYGPDSVETHDYYLRTDLALGELIADLDRQFGADYTLILTSDHGVAPMPEYSDIPGAGRFDFKVELPKLLAQAVADLELSPAPTLTITHGVDLQFASTVPEAERARLRARLAELLRADERIADAWTRDELASPPPRETPQREHADAWRRSFHPDRSSDVLIQLAPGVVTYPEGTGHGTPYAYDQHVPLIVRGPGWAGTSSERVATVDIAPTIAALLGVPAPDDLDGRALARE
jgi:predicted AlkP superfamily pyrophosphatase or phosphodiesterase